MTQPTDTATPEQLEDSFREAFANLIATHPYFRRRVNCDFEMFGIWRDGKLIEVSLSVGRKWRVSPKQQG